MDLMTAFMNMGDEIEALDRERLVEEDGNEEAACAVHAVIVAMQAALALLQSRCPALKDRPVYNGEDVFYAAPEWLELYMTQQCPVLDEQHTQRCIVLWRGLTSLLPFIRQSAAMVDPHNRYITLDDLTDQTLCART